MTTTLSTITVLGAGTMGHGIAHVCAAAGYTTRLFDVRRELVDAGLAKVAQNLETGVQKGKVTAEQKAAALALLSGSADLAAAVAGADLVVEAVPEKLELKQSLFKEVAAATSAATILATNTSSLSVSPIAAACRGPSG